MNLVDLENDRREWSLKTFPVATALSSLLKLKEETSEIEADINNDVRRPEEYADALMCLFDSAARQKIPILPEEIVKAFAKKMIKNKNRVWVKNDDNTYSHVKKNG